MTSARSSREALLLVLVLAGAALAGEPASAGSPGGDPVKLVYKPTPGPVDYWIRTIESTGREDPTTGSDWHSYDVLELVTQQATANAQGALEFTVQTREKEMWVDSKQVPVEFPRTSFGYSIGPRGDRVDALATVEPAAALGPVFPDQPIAPGHRWQATVPPSAKFDIPIPVTHVFERVETYRGKPCALITSQGATKGKDKDKPFGYSLKLSSSLLLGLEDGVLVKSISFLTLSAKGLKPGARKPAILRQQIQRIVQRRTAGEAAPAGAPGPESR